ncbi:hypothetical protein D6L40_24770 [Vibrio alginolyticus]|nr:hypothetical protein [Vibrio alginolyticus]EGR1563338.1 hypothetical protein [Vibrio alginolyticus]EGR1574633.1 hypothetical protein [Vibrio alginolyticus]
MAILAGSIIDKMSTAAILNNHMKNFTKCFYILFQEFTFSFSGQSNKCILFNHETNSIPMLFLNRLNL